MPRPLTEKTLELNVMAELAYLGRMAGYSPYFIGFSQLDEMIHGGDSFFSAGARIGFFQFKRGYHRSKFFTFYINGNKPHFNQHQMLTKTNSVCGACRYVFPLIGTNQDVYSHRGNLLAWTAFLPPGKFDPLSPPNEAHRIRIYNQGRWRRYSDEKEGEWRNIFGQLPSDAQSIDETLRNRPSGEPLGARSVFNSLELPVVETVLARIADQHEQGIEQIFEQRSSFCMVFNEN